jgi:hypothetical protein
MILLFLFKMLSAGPAMVDCKKSDNKCFQEFRADAKAEGDEVGVGGWLVHPDGPKCSKWFCLKLNRKTAPWAFRSGEPFKTIASLELFATLLCLKAFGLCRKNFSGGRISLSGLTDNQGNSHAVARLLTTKFPLCAFLMEISATLQAAESELELEWVPREQNLEADELSNFDTRNFSAQLEVKITADTVPFILLDEFLVKGEEMYSALAKIKDATPPCTVIEGKTSRKRKRNPETRLRTTHPW